MDLKTRLNEDMKAAMRAKDQTRLDALRLLSAAIKKREIDERLALDDAGVMAVIDKLVKQNRDAVEQFAKGGRPDLADKENREIAVWQAYLPAPLSEPEVDQLIEAAVSETGASSMKDMGKVVGALKPKLQGRADMGQVSAKVKQRLSS